MKNKKEISKYVSVINVILIVIIVNIFINKNVLVGKEKQTIKEMTQSENEANLQTQINALNASHKEYSTNVQGYKKQIADAITNQGVETSADVTAEVMATNIGKILTAKTQATATAAQILTEQTAYVNGKLVTGTMKNNGAITQTLNAGGSYTIPVGYHNGSGKVTASTLESQTSGTATASDIASGKTAWVNGSKITGTQGENNLNYITVTFPQSTVWQSSKSVSITSLYSDYKNITIDNIIPVFSNYPALEELFASAPYFSFSYTASSGTFTVNCNIKMRTYSTFSMKLYII